MSIYVLKKHKTMFLLFYTSYNLVLGITFLTVTLTSWNVSSESNHHRKEINSIYMNKFFMIKED